MPAIFHPRIAKNIKVPSVRVRKICSDHRLLRWDSDKDVDCVLTSPESILHKIIIIILVIKPKIPTTVSYLSWWLINISQDDIVPSKVIPQDFCKNSAKLSKATFQFHKVYFKVDSSLNLDSFLPVISTLGWSLLIFNECSRTYFGEDWENFWHKCKFDKVLL